MPPVSGLNKKTVGKGVMSNYWEEGVSGRRNTNKQRGKKEHGFVWEEWGLRGFGTAVIESTGQGVERGEMGVVGRD